MQRTQLLFSQDLYEKSLATIINIHFTSREIDVIACLLSGRKTSKIAQFLSINPRTVETHLSHIMSKLECNTREGIIDFIEASDKIHLLRKHYALLQIETIFEKCLTDIAQLHREMRNCCFLKFEGHTDPLVKHLKSNLSLTGLTVLSSGAKEGDYIIILVPITMTVEVSLHIQKELTRSKDVIFLVQDRKNHLESLKGAKDFDVIDFANCENYYFSFFTLFQKILPNVKIDRVVSNFKDQYQKIHCAPSVSQVSLNQSATAKILSFKTVSMVLLVFLITCSSYFALRWNQKNNDNTIRSDLVIPRESVILLRPNLVAQIENKFKKGKGIQTVAVVGAGGSGKTTIARQYARQQKVYSIWEINAETHESLKTSFEHLAQAFIKTDADRKVWREIEKITDSIERENRIIQFVKERLKSKSDWFLIYDNVDKFEDIKKYFPQDGATWGQGRILLTTRDANIGSNEHVNHVLHIGELDPQEKLSFFSKIMTSENARPLTETQVKEAKHFLEKIPAFPLDVSIAAYYLKTTGVSYDSYLKYLEESPNEFEKVNTNILQDASDYKKTRYNIIALSLEQIIKTHQEFLDLLLFISLLDSQNIPKDLLKRFKSDVIVDNFIFHLKKYSLLTNTQINLSSSNSHFSIHRSTQNITLAYLTKVLGLEKNKKPTSIIAENLERTLNEALQKEDMIKMKGLIKHCDAFLRHRGLLNDRIEGIIKSKLGIIHFFFKNAIKAKSLLGESIIKLVHFHEEDAARIAFGYLGNVYRDLGEYNNAKTYLEKSVSLYQKKSTDNFKEYAGFLVYLGIIDTYLGNYVAAKHSFESSLSIHKSHFPQDIKFSAWASGQLGVLERILGNYNKAEILLEDCLSKFKKDPYLSDIDHAWALQHLGLVYLKLEKYEKANLSFQQSLKLRMSLFPDAVGPLWILSHLNSEDALGKDKDVKSLFNKLLEIYKGHFHESYIDAGWHLGQLGNLYKQLGNYEKAKILLEQDKAILEKNLGVNHLGIALILNDLGEVYLLQGQLEKAESFMNRAFLILEKNNHPTQHQCLENLSKLYIKKALLEKNKIGKEGSQNLQRRALDYLKQALISVKAYFPKDSSHITRIQMKLNTLE